MLSPCAGLLLPCISTSGKAPAGRRSLEFFVLLHGSQQLDASIYNVLMASGKSYIALALARPKFAE